LPDSKWQDAIYDSSDPSPKFVFRDQALSQPMKTKERAQALSLAAQPFSELLGPSTVEDLLAWVEAELGDAAALDQWIRHGQAQTKALAPQSILHVFKSNTPHAALHSLIGGLLLGAHNRVKLPSSGLAEVEEFMAGLPEALRRLVVTAGELDRTWLTSSDAVVAYGSEESIAKLRLIVPSGRIFLGHPEKASLGIIWDDPESASCPEAARDASLFDQQGVLSPQVFYVREVTPGFVRNYAKNLSQAMAAFNGGQRGRKISTAERAEIANLRAAYRFRASGDLRVALWEGGGEAGWSVVYEEDPWFPATSIPRVIFVKPLPENLAESMGPAAEYLGAVGLWPCEKELAERFFNLQPSRFCSLGRMQPPPWTWHQGGGSRLASLVKWVDFEPTNLLTA
jgi:hypothetical protein